MKSLITLLLAALLLGCNDAGRKAPLDDFHGIQGTWLVEFATDAWGDFDWLPGEMTIEGTNLLRRFCHHPERRFTFQLHPTNPPHKLITLRQEPAGAASEAVRARYILLTSNLALHVAAPNMEAIMLGDDSVISFTRLAPRRWSARPARTNTMQIHLQGGFDGGTEVVVSVEGREVYRGLPQTHRIWGIVKALTVVTTSACPVVTCSVPHRALSWSDTVDLRAGSQLGINLNTFHNALHVWQSHQFGYE